MKDCCEKKKRWFQNKLLIILLFDLLLYSGGYFLPLLKPFQEPFRMYLRMIAWALAIGFLFGGLIDHFVPSEYISKILARPKKRTIFYASGLGLLMSACSHGILAIGMELHKKGASGPAVISFLLGSPWANLPVTILLLSLFKMKGLLIIASALFVSLTTGLFFLLLDRWGWIEKNKNASPIDESFSITSDVKKRWQGTKWSWQRLRSDTRGVFDGAIRLADMILWWILLGITIASLISSYVPSHFFHQYMGPTFVGLLITLAAATVIEVCSEGSAPLAFEIYRQTGSIGNTFVFLMGGFVTDYTEIGLLWTNLGRRTALWMMALTIPQVLFLGWIYNRLFI
ncbi:MAG: permease [Deltaproteobacteria bacterium]|nr:permease [Deltaproteobacteria bacterium]